MILNNKVIPICCAFLSILMILPIVTISTTAWAAPAAPSLNSYVSGNHVKLEWGVDMSSTDILTKTGFESGDEIPHMEWHANDYGNQAVIDAPGGGKALRLNDTITGKTGNQFDYPQTNSITSFSQFAGRSLPGNSTVSITFRALATAGNYSSLQFAASTGWFDRGFNFMDLNGKMVKYRDQVNWSSSPLKLYAYVDGGTISLPNGAVYVIVSAHNTDYNYGVTRYIWDDQNKVFNRFPDENQPWGNTAPKGQTTVANKDTFTAGEPLLLYRQTGVSFPVREIASDGQWKIFSANAVLPGSEYYDYTNRGVTSEMYWKTNGTVYIDDIKFGYATPVNLYRNNQLIYNGYLSDYDDTAAMDTTAPEPVSDVQVGVNNRYPTLSWQPSTGDQGTTYNYNIQSLSTTAGSSAMSATKPVTVTSGLKGYSVVVDNQPSTVPDNTIETTSTHYTWGNTMSSNFYVHIAAVDVQGNISTVIHQKYTDTTLPQIVAAPHEQSWQATDIHVQLSYTDLFPGIDSNQRWYKVTSSSKMPETWDYATDDRIDILLKEEGTWYIHAKVSDLADNSATFTSGKYQIQREPLIPNLSAISPSAHQVNLSWNLTANAALTEGDSYTIRNQTTGKSWIVAYPVQTITDDSLIGGQQYSYTIQTRNNVGTSAESEVINIKTRPDAPSSVILQRDDQQPDQAYITIPTVSSAEHYRIEATPFGSDHADIDMTVTDATYRQLQGLQPYTMYDISVTAINSSGAGEAYHTSFLTLPGLLDSFQSAQIWESAIQLTWNTVTRATYDWSTVAGDTYYHLNRDQTHIYEGKEITFIDQGLHAGTPYHYAVSASNATGKGQNIYLSDIWTLPPAVQQYKHVDSTKDTISLAWSSAQGATGYELLIEEQKNTLNYALIDNKTEQSAAIKVNIAGNINQYTVPNLLAGKTYSVAIRPQNKSGYGAVQTLIASTLPDIPNAQDIYIKDITENEVTMHLPEIEGATKYQLIIKSEDSKLIRKYELSDRELHINDLSGDTLYTYELSGGNNAGYGASAVGTFLTTPIAPTNLILTGVNSSTLSYQWDKQKHTDKYVIYTDHDLAWSDQTTNNAYTHSALNAGSTYHYRIVAQNASGVSRPAQVTYRTLPQSIDQDQAHIKLTDISTNKISLIWHPVQGADGYLIYNDQQVLLADVHEAEATIKELTSATRYTGWTIVPYNSAGSALPLTVPNIETLPSDQVKISIADQTKKEITLLLEHELVHEMIVITLNGKEIYRGQDHSFVATSLQPDKKYTFKVWTENKQGDRSSVISYTAKTNKEREVTVLPTHPFSMIPDQLPEPLEWENEVDTQSATEQSDVIIGTPTILNQQTNTITEFTDIDHSFSQQEIKMLAQIGMIQGTTATTYEPNRGITRAEFMSLLVRMKQWLHADTDTSKQTKGISSTNSTITVASTDVPFTDVDSQAWYREDLVQALDLKIAKGFSNTIFAPQSLITREQAYRMMINTIVGEIDSQPSSKLTFRDADRIAQWATGSIAQAQANDLVKGYPNAEFKPKKQLTRAEAAMLLYRVVNQNQ